MNFEKWALAGIIVIAPSFVVAEEAKPWKADSELGFVVTDGNTETRTVNGKLDVTNEIPKWRNNLHLEALNTSEAIRTSAEKYLASLQSDYKFSSVDFIFSITTYENDRFNASGYDYQVTTAVGYGRTVFKDSHHSLNLEVGPGYRYSKIKISGENQEEGIIRASGKYRLKMSDTAELQQDLNIDAGEIETISKSVTAVKAQVVGQLAMKVSLTIRHTDTPSVSNESVDRETALTLVYAF